MIGFAIYPPMLIIGYTLVAMFVFRFAVPRLARTWPTQPVDREGILWATIGAFFMAVLWPVTAFGVCLVALATLIVRSNP